MSKSVKINNRPVLPLPEAAKLPADFAIFELNLSPEEAAALKKLKIADTATYDNFAARQDMDGDVSRFLESLGNSRDVSVAASKVITRLHDDVLAAFKAEAAWLTLRAFLPTADFDTPRWHQDGRFYKAEEGVTQKKAAFALVGTNTLFKDADAALRKQFHGKEGAFKTDERDGLATALASVPTVTADNGQGAIFSVGTAEGAIHSEPPIPAERLFVSVVPGSKAQIEDLRQFWKKKPTTYSPK